MRILQAVSVYVLELVTEEFSIFRILVSTKTADLTECFHLQ
jgi:hypothetical protein